MTLLVKVIYFEGNNTNGFAWDEVLHVCGEVSIVGGSKVYVLLDNPELSSRSAKNISCRKQNQNIIMLTRPQNPELLKSFKRRILILLESVTVHELRKCAEVIDIMGIT